MPHHPCACYQKLLAIDFLKLNGTFCKHAPETWNIEGVDVCKQPTPNKKFLYIKG